MSDDTAVIHISCTSCGKRLKVSSKSAGKRVKCPKCACVLTVPAADAGGDDQFLADLDSVLGAPMAVTGARQSPKLPPKKRKKAATIQQDSAPSNWRLVLIGAGAFGILVCMFFAMLGLYGIFASRAGLAYSSILNKGVEAVTGNESQIDLFGWHFGRGPAFAFAIGGVIGGLLLSKFTIGQLNISLAESDEEIERLIKDMDPEEARDTRELMREIDEMFDD